MAKKSIKNIFLVYVLFLFLLTSFQVVESKDKKITNIIKEEIVNQEENEYLGILEIPKINLKQGFYEYLSKNNNVNKNIEVIETSLMPDNENSNLILASHSGNSNISYFKNLYKLKINDYAYIYYKGRQYVYRLSYKYDEVKDGLLSIRTKKNQVNLTLITCDKLDNHLQNVYVFSLTNKY